MAYNGDYGSEFENDSDIERKKRKRSDLIPKAKHSTSGIASKHEVTDQYNKEEGKIHRFHNLSLDAFARHKQLVNNYIQYYGGSMKDIYRDTRKDKRDIDVIRENHQFLWDEDEGEADDTWDRRLAKKYYTKLFKEYAICDLSRYKENKVALRWCIEKEVIEGKGQFVCGNKKCTVQEGLRTWEVNFGYIEKGTKKNALVKLRLCADCSYKLNYHHKKKEVTKRKSHKKMKTSEKDRHESGRYSPTWVEPQISNTKESEAPKCQEITSIWSGPVKIQEEKSREEEMNDYLNDLFQ
ncbi:unnamed protein product [Owenia fusiformis]|uniref:Uncharacterized protein n=1 Tax=Owenia fusiformis TaxID=6347 RepID=A0A8J1US59_OWEFU|nr:unnamed protein product [Owenia fusiformis]